MIVFTRAAAAVAWPANESLPACCCCCAQVQYSLLDRRPENEMVSYCLDKGIGLLPYGVVAGGLLSDK